MSILRAGMMFLDLVNCYKIQDSFLVFTMVIVDVLSWKAL
jgi:hypothetical protein